MIADPFIAKHYPAARRALKTYRDKDRAKERMLEEGISEVEAGLVIDYVFDDNVRANRKLGIYYFVGAGIGTAAVIGVWLVTERLFYIALPIACIATILGMFQSMFPSGYSVMIPTETGSD